MKEIKTIFKYGDSPMFDEDFEVICEEDLESEYCPHLYTIGIEGYVYFEKLEHLISYYEKFKTKYLEFLKNQYNFKPKKQEQCYYRSYDIELYYNEKVGYNVYVNCPYYSNIEDTYYWINGVINQLKNINDLENKDRDITKSLTEALQEVELIREGKLPKTDWKEFIKELEGEVND